LFLDGRLHRRVIFVALHVVPAGVDVAYYTIAMAQS